MAACELRRIPAGEVDSANLLASLALRAEAVLGYSWLRRKLKVQPGSLAVTLQELGIEPFRPQDVKHYKAERLRTAREAVTAEYEHRSRGENFTFELPPGTYVRGKWRRSALKGFQGEVPAFALSHAIEIKERMPKVEFEVDFLSIDSRYDPFLIARCGRERYYIDVWDEAEFEQQHYRS